MSRKQTRPPAEATGETINSVGNVDIEFHRWHTERKRKNMAMGSRAITASNRSSGKSFQICCSIASSLEDLPDDFPRLLSLRDFLDGCFRASIVLKLPDFPAAITRPQKSSTE
ncbi:hypothetical protein CR513_10654, partial [Mucuna pruriens]